MTRIKLAASFKGTDKVSLRCGLKREFLAASDFKNLFLAVDVFLSGFLSVSGQKNTKTIHNAVPGLA